MKRINPDTGAPFKRGDERPDGRVFRAYKKRLKSDGNFMELWNAPETIKTQNTLARTSMIAKRLGAERGDHLIRRVSQTTGKPYLIGEQDSQGRYFICYRNYSFDHQHFHEEWASPARWHRMHIESAVQSARKRARKIGVPFEIDVPYMESIYPKDGLCPALKFKMSWGSKNDRTMSPSVDRVLPELGYVKGNLVWLSMRANVIKNDASLLELENVLSWLTTLLAEKARDVICEDSA